MHFSVLPNFRWTIDTRMYGIPPFDILRLLMHTSYSGWWSFFFFIRNDYACSQRYVSSMDFRSKLLIVYWTNNKLPEWIVFEENLFSHHCTLKYIRLTVVDKTHNVCLMLSNVFFFHQLFNSLDSSNIFSLSKDLFTRQFVSLSLFFMYLDFTPMLPY